MIITIGAIGDGDSQAHRVQALQAEAASVQGEHLGHVGAFEVDDNRWITYLALEHRYLWGKREVHVAIDAVQRIDNDEVVLSLSKDEVGRVGERVLARAADPGPRC